MFNTSLLRTVVLLVLLFSVQLLQGQNAFHGSFLMTFKSSDEKSEDPPMLWNIEQESKGGRMAMELQDEMQKKGVSKRVLFNPKDSTWTMLMSFNNVRQGSRIHRAEMFREKKDQKKIAITSSSEKRIIEGYHCKKIITESKNYKAEIWIAKDLNFDICYIYKLLNHCSMMSDIVRRGDWFNWNIPKGMIMEVTSTKKSTGEFYTMSISSVKINEIDPLLFTTKDFRISEIPEGQNCGVSIEEK